MAFPDGYEEASDAEIPGGVIPLIVDDGAGGRVTRWVTVERLGVQAQQVQDFALTFSVTPSSGIENGDPMTLTAVTSGGSPDYTVNFYDGDPAAGGELLVGSPVAVEAGQNARKTYVAQGGARYDFYAVGADSVGRTLTKGPISRTAGEVAGSGELEATFTVTPTSGLAQGDTLTLSCSPSGGTAGYTVRFYQGSAGGTLVGTAKTVPESGGTATVTTTATEGTTTFYAVVVDTAGADRTKGPVSRTATGDAEPGSGDMDFTATPASGLQAGDVVALRSTPSGELGPFAVRWYGGDPNQGGNQIGVTRSNVASGATVEHDFTTQEGTYALYSTATDAQGGVVERGPIQRVVQPAPAGAATLRKRRALSVSGLPTTATAPGSWVASERPSEYPARLEVPVSAGMNADRSDLRITDTDGTTILPHWVEADDGATLVVWVAAPITAASSRTLYACYDSATAVVGASNPARVFEAFDDFDEAAPEGDAFAADVNAWYGLNGPRGQYHPATDKTILCYEGPGAHPYVVAYHHGSGTWEGPFQAGVSGLSLDDQHGNPALIVDAAGTVHVVYGAHSGNTPDMGYAVADVADLSTWTDRTATLNAVADMGYATYPHFHEFADGRLWVTARGAGEQESGHYADWSYVESSDGGLTWSDRTPFLRSPSTSEPGVDEAQAWYIRRVSDGDDLHVAFAYKTQQDAQGNSEPRHNTYYITYNSVTSTWRDAAGTVLQMPLTKAEADTVGVVRVVDSEVDDSRTDHPSLRIFGGTVHILYPRGFREGTYSRTEEDFTAFHTYWDAAAGAWSAPVAVSDLAHNHAYRELAVVNGALEAFVIRTSEWTTSANGDMVRLRWDGAAWSEVGLIFEADYVFQGSHVVTLDNSHPDARLVFMGVPGNFSGSSGGLGAGAGGAKLGFLWGGSGFVRRGLALPTTDRWWPIGGQVTQGGGEASVSGDGFVISRQRVGGLGWAGRARSRQVEQDGTLVSLRSYDKESTSPTTFGYDRVQILNVDSKSDGNYAELRVETDQREGTSNTSYVGGLDTRDDHTYEVRWLAGRSEYYQDGTLLRSQPLSNQLADTELAVSVGRLSSSVEGTVSADWMLVRKAADVEPSVSVGATETGTFEVE